MDGHPRIASDPGLLSGKPVIKGTRLSVEFVIGLLAAGWSHDDVLREYPSIGQDDVIACLAFARDVLQSHPHAAE